jgi:hypothetical protein
MGSSLASTSFLLSSVVLGWQRFSRRQILCRTESVSRKLRRCYASRTPDTEHIHVSSYVFGFILVRSVSTRTCSSIVRLRHVDAWSCFRMQRIYESIIGRAYTCRTFLPSDLEVIPVKSLL